MRILIFLLTVIISFCVNAQGDIPDSTKVIGLDEIIISDSINNSSLDAFESGSHLNKMVLEKIIVDNIGDATRFIKGVSLKDYGGVGGLKTVSVRGLGANNTGVVYDGIGISDLSNGQIDLSKISSNNIESINLYNAQAYSMLQTAKGLSTANVLFINSQTPIFDSLEKLKLGINTSFGSFLYANFNNYLAYKISDNWVVSNDLEITNTNGRYPYIMKYGGEKDSTSREIRENSDYFGLRNELNLYGNWKKSDIRLKAYYFYSDRGLPGSTTMYYLRSRERLWDESFFAQSVYTHRFTPRLTYKNHSKFLYSKTRYLDPDFPNQEGKREDLYKHNEFYTNNLINYKINNRLSATITSDLIYNKMNSISAFSALPSRFTSLNAAIASYNYGGFFTIANLLHTYSQDRAMELDYEKNHSHLSPFISIGYSFKNNLSLSLFFKDVYRMPTFNDLYFNIVTAPKLRPEKAKQYNLHLDYYKDLGFSPAFLLNLSADIYYNKVEDKIMAIPSRNLFIWSIINYGEVDIKGMDIEMGLRTYLKYSLDLWIRGTYSYQIAQDISKPNNDGTYNQIPYTPINSGSLILGVNNPLGEINYTISFVGKRYSMIENIDRNLLKPYQDHGIMIGKTWELKKYDIGSSISFLNVFGTQYEVVRNYPMPRNQIRINIKINFK